jgi:hypothetical protein
MCLYLANTRRQTGGKNRLGSRAPAWTVIFAATCGMVSSYSGAVMNKTLVDK